MTWIVKLGGELLGERKAAEAQAIAQDLQTLRGHGKKLVLVHGGGPQTTALQEALGQKAHFVGGRRVTDRDALEAAKMVVGGKLNSDFVSLLASAGISAIGLSGVSGRVIQAVKRPPRVVTGGGDLPVDFGFVGDVVGVNQVLLELLLGAGHVPVLASLGADEAGQPLNINADAVAAGVSAALSAEGLVLLTSTPGVLRSIADPSSRFPRLSRAEAQTAIQTGVIVGGMIPKVEEGLAALDRGVRQVLIAGAIGPGDLVRALEAPGSAGTWLVRD